ncbi:MAG TPA: heat-shock protein Hsp70, partial [Planctomycetaceae bacterium]|nr:heat-shock protein Hsp70 [Planctomycetaceae bacterium]
RPRAAITVQHGSNRQTYQVGQEEFEDRSHGLISRSEGITRRILSKNGFGWAHVDVVLMTGGSSRMPMVRNSLKQLSGRTLNSSLSPDQSIAHGAAYYAGMLLSNQQHTRTVFNSQASSRLSSLKQQGVNARGLGILIRDTNSGKRIPVYLIPPNTALPASRTHVFGTVVDHQTKVHVRIVESGTGPGHAHTVLGDCHITDLPPDLPEGSEVEVTISYDRNARVHVSARELKSGRSAEAEIIRRENVLAQLQEDTGLTLRKPAEDFEEDEPISIETEAVPELVPIEDPPNDGSVRTVDSDWQIETVEPAPSLTGEWAAFSDSLNEFKAVEPESIDSPDQPVPLCNVCGGFLVKEGVCPDCGEGPPRRKKKRKRGPVKAEGNATRPRKRRRKATQKKPAESPPPAETPAGESTGEAEFWELLD